MHLRYYGTALFALLGILKRIIMQVSTGKLCNYRNIHMATNLATTIGGVIRYCSAILCLNQRWAAKAENGNFPDGGERLTRTF